MNLKTHLEIHPSQSDRILIPHELQSRAGVLWWIVLALTLSDSIKAE